MKRGRVLVAVAAMALCWSQLGHAAPPQADASAVSAVLRSLRSADAGAGPLVYRDAAGYLRFVGAPTGGYFVVPGGAKSGDPEAVAQDFIGYHGPAFGAVSDSVSLEVARTLTVDGRQVVRLEQSYSDLPVFGASMVVQIDASGHVLSAASDLALNVNVLDQGEVSLTPTLTADEASAIAKQLTAQRHDAVSEADLIIIKRPELEVYDPQVLGHEGAVRLVWHVLVYSENPMDGVVEAVLIDAHSGAEALYFHYCAHLKNRIILDFEDRNFTPLIFERTEGQAETEIDDVDLTYDVLGQVHDFYLENHGWENWHGGQVADRTDQLAFVRLPVFNAFYIPWVDTPFAYDSFTGVTFYGTGLATDDVVAHEFTHGVTQFTSDLIYQGFSGAINESFSDIWGEFVDLTNDVGDDRDEVRWRLGEDISDALFDQINIGSADLSIRDMADPTLFGDPDRLTSPLLIDPESPFDNGGVHINSGIGNKLAYLLTDGDDFNGQSVEGIGILDTADVFWEAQNLIPSSGDYFDLYFALSQGAFNLGWTTEERVNLLNAMKAVEIVPESQAGIYLRGVPTDTVSGRPAISLDWPDFNTRGLVSVQLIRSLEGFADTPEEGTVVYDGLETAFLDYDVLPGVTYYYTLLVDLGENGLIEAFAAVEAGGQPAPVLTEAFSEDDRIDLSNTQLLFAPVGPPNTDVPGSSRPTGYESYELTITRNVTSLPVPRSDQEGQGVKLPFVEDEAVIFPADNLPFRFFGTDYPSFYVYEQGFISFELVDITSPNYVPTLDGHFNVPRISFLFDNLSPTSGGEAWYRTLDDRFVLTFDSIPEWTPSSVVQLGTNTVQVEMFYTGHIRITYLELSVSQAIVGLSDGRGFPVSPSELFTDATSEFRLVDISESPLAPTRLRIEPVDIPVVTPGDVVEFDVVTTAPAGAPGTPQILAAWSRGEAVPFADNGDGTGTFRWETDALDTGLTFVRFTAFQGAQTAYIDVRIFLDGTEAEPVAINLTLSTESGLGDPTRDRTVEPGQALFADYDFDHPGLSRPLPGNPLRTKQTSEFSEGYTELRWYRNNLVQAAYTGSFVIPAGTTRPNERWKFSVLPITRSGLVGVETFSPTVTVLDVPQISSVTPNFGAVTGGDTVTINGANLGAPLSVRFGGVEARNFISLGNDGIEAVTPVRTAGTVEVTVITAKGSGFLPRAFSFMTNVNLVPTPDVNKDGTINALDLQIVVSDILEQTKDNLDSDVNKDGVINAADVQAVINAALQR